MSYSILITYSDGTPTVKTVGPVPDGLYTINGHEDETVDSFNATREARPGHPRLQALVYVNKEV